MHDTNPSTPKMKLHSLDIMNREMWYCKRSHQKKRSNRRRLSKHSVV